MINEAVLDGKTRQFLFGNYAFKKLYDEQGVSMLDFSNQLQTGNFSLISDVAYWAMKAADVYFKRSGDYTPDEVAVWLDMEPGLMPKVINWVTESITSLFAAPDDAKKKEKPKTGRNALTDGPNG